MSTTGYGEGMIRLATAHSAVERMRAGSSAADAAREIIAHLAARLDVTGGVIAVDRNGRFGLARSTATMSWAAAGDWGEESGV
ncbi:hypothetical protein BE04_35325 [Sorangium cellulosum]|uniref:Asparaginase n=1 Tax=Sorangium cellulosum TaxID=56 RepID=A0A150PK06_SORCE|nr:hypothetical protein BE04_35325 [Sorangium cellulosum]